MEPLLNSGDFVIYKPLKQAMFLLKRGSIVVAEHPYIANKLILKRIEKIEENGYFLIGDNKESSSDSRNFGIVNSNQIIGIAIQGISLQSLKLIKF
tara:strand:- start:5978 stop:6265 length:288 start_codon:yes stop_codon:yes gene_type:complete